MIFVKKYDSISSFYFLMVGIGFVLGGFKYGFGTWRSPGPGFLPLVFGFLLMVLSIILGVTCYRTRQEVEHRSFWRIKGSWKSVSFTVLSLVVFTLFLETIGFILATFFFIFFMLKFICTKGWRISLGMAFVLSISSFVLFSTILGTPLPRGPIYEFIFRIIDWF